MDAKQASPPTERPLPPLPPTLWRPSVVFGSFFAVLVILFLAEHLIGTDVGAKRPDRINRELLAEYHQTLKAFQDVADMRGEPVEHVALRQLQQNIEHTTDPLERIELSLERAKFLRGYELAVERNDLSPLARRRLAEGAK